MLARRLLPHAGGAASFAPPVYTGVLTAGSITTITDNSAYNAWPVVCRLANHNLLLAYTTGAGHHSDNSGKAVGKLSTDDGATWGAEFTIYDDPSLWTTVMGISQVSSGRIIATLWRDNVGTPYTEQAGVAYSDDNGTSWTTWIGLVNGFTQDCLGSGPVIELANGDLLVTIEGNPSGDTTEIQNSSHTMLSTDDGVTWGSEVTVRDYDSRPYFESKLVKLDTGNLLCVHRCAANTPGTHYISTSTDSGATWGAPVSQFTGYGAPSTTQASWGTLVTVTRRNSDAACIAYASIDRGATWLSAVTLDATMYEMEYGCAVQTLDSRWLVVYGYQPTSSITNSDIKQIYVTEGHS